MGEYIFAIFIYFVFFTITRYHNFKLDEIMKSDVQNKENYLHVFNLAKLATPISFILMMNSTITLFLEFFSSHNELLCIILIGTMVGMANNIARLVLEHTRKSDEVGE